MDPKNIFDEWSKKYDQWFETPIGKLIKKFENTLILEMLKPKGGEKILDPGCGTGIFTDDVLKTGAQVVGLELSMPMLLGASKKRMDYPLYLVQGDMRALPFDKDTFDKTISVTAIEFIEDARGAIEELFRVTRPGGCIVVATLNRLSPWASRRAEAAKKDHPIFKHVFFRSPEDMLALASSAGVFKTAVHFQKDDDPEEAEVTECACRNRGLETGAFLVVRWIKPNPEKLESM
ncbi:MAG: class I SAM-dependent methyltransferase [Deltaproteobacteria bacterium]|nr:class I SAM-dependent methyltransferase [Deltaproteobacteria bacterium]